MDCEGPFFHTTTWDRLQTIAMMGLSPDYGSRFGGFYAGWSRGKLFVAQGKDAADWWFDLIANLCEQDVELSEEDDYLLVVPVMLRIDMRGLKLRVDETGSRDYPCAFYVEQRLDPRRIWFYDGSNECWTPVSDWQDSDPSAALQSLEEEWGENEDEGSWWNIDLREPWDEEPGAFAPSRHSEEHIEDWKHQLGWGSRSHRRGGSMGQVIRLPSRKVMGEELATLLYGEDPYREQLRRCVLSVYEKQVAKGGKPGRGTLSKSFAICTANLQRHGYLYKDTNQPTKKGKAASLKKLQDAAAGQKRARYQAVLSEARGPTPNLDQALSRALGKPVLALSRSSSKSKGSSLDAILKRRLG